MEIEPGQIRELRGSNGSGKTTLLRVLLSLQRPDAGRVIRYTARLGYVGHRPGLTGPLTLLENLRWLIAIAKLESSDASIRSKMDSFGLASYAKTPVNELSAGQVKRGALCALALSEHQLWLLDEPLASLDSEGEELLNSMLVSHSQTGGSALIATHEPILAASSERIELGPQ